MPAVDTVSRSYGECCGGNSRGTALWQPPAYARRSHIFKEETSKDITRKVLDRNEAAAGAEGGVPLFNLRVTCGPALLKSLEVLEKVAVRVSRLRQPGGM